MVSRNRLVVFGVVGVIVVWVLWYLVSPLFIVVVVNESLPFVSEGSSAVIVNGVSGGLEEEVVQEKVSSLSAQLLEGFFVDADTFHKVSGKVVLLEQEGERVLSFTDFSSTNGPALKVYLARGIDASDYVSLGDLKGTKGNFHYVVDDGVDLEKYNTVLIWCEPFRVLFGYAGLE